MWSCGLNQDGQLGDGTTINRTTPVQVSAPVGLSNITSIARGGGHSIFLKNNGTAWACGNNTQGELGDGTDTSRNIPVQLINLCAVSTDVKENTIENDVSVYPNPASYKLIVQSSKFNVERLEVYDVIGQLQILNFQHPTSSIHILEINVSHLSQGIYFCKLITESGAIVKKFVKQ